MAGNTMTLTFAGDASQLRQAAQQSTNALDDVNNAATTTAGQMDDAADSGSNLSTRMGHLGGAVSGATDAIDSVGGSLSAVNDLMNMSANRAAAQRRALLAVDQAQEDYNQALRDSSQAAIDSGQAQIDLEQANLDAAIALDDYNAAVKEHGANSNEAKQASLDLKQAQQDITQANEDAAQYTRDASQAVIDQKTAQEDLNDAMKEAHPPQLQKWADTLQMLTPILTAAVGVVGLVTAAQWAWNAAQLASPTTWIVLAIVALIAVVVLIATKTTWFQDLWRVAWSGIKDAASAVGTWFKDVLWGVYIKGTYDGIASGISWVKDKFVEHLGAIKKTGEVWWGWLSALPDKLKSAFASVGSFITAPFRAAFNYVSDAWNNTVGRLSWSVPGWVPGIGGNSIGAPKLPHFHTGGIVSGALGAETLAVLRSGEKVTGGTNDGHAERIVIDSAGSRLDDLLLEVLRGAISKRGGNVQRVLGTTRG